jgi:opacity protein-like surface antigen
MEYGWDATDTQKNLDITTIPVLANLRYGQRCSDQEMGWYGYGGLGWAFNDLEDNSAEMRADGSFAWQIGAGVEYPVAAGLDVFLDVRYLWNRSNIDIPNGATRVAPDDAVLSSVLFTTGVKF